MPFLFKGSENGEASFTSQKMDRIELEDLLSAEGKLMLIEFSVGNYRSFKNPVTFYTSTTHIFVFGIELKPSSRFNVGVARAMTSWETSVKWSCCGFIMARQKKPSNATRA